MNIIILILLFIIPAIFYTLATFYGSRKNLSFWWSLLFSVIFASIEYLFKNPIVNSMSKDHKFPFWSIQLIWIILTLVIAYFFQKL